MFITYGLMMNFDVEHGEFVQVLHTGDGHWMTVATIGMKHAKVQASDSLYMRVSTMAKAQIAILLRNQPSKSSSWTSRCSVGDMTVATGVVLGE